MKISSIKHQFSSLFRIAILKMLLLFCAYSLAQDGAKYEIQGEVRDTVSGKEVRNVRVFNKTTNSFLFTVSPTKYRGVINPKDTLIIKFNFNDSLIYVVPEKLKDTLLKVVHNVDASVRTFDDVYIYFHRELRELRDDRKSLNNYEKSKPPPIMSPASFLYYYLSKRERNKRRLTAIKQKERKKDILREYVYICVNSGWVELSPAEIDLFLSEFTISDQEMQQLSNIEFLQKIKTGIEEMKGESKGR